MPGPHKHEDPLAEVDRVPVISSPSQATTTERKSSALVGVWYAERLHKAAIARAEAARAGYVEAIVAARDAGATVAEVAEQAGVSRNALYLLVARARKSS